VILSLGCPHQTWSSPWLVCLYPEIKPSFL
jgi:hypothetical protein